MLFEKIETEGLAHYSYIIGDQNEAVVIDPRRDVEIYLKKATKAGFKIKYILETHRNEDYVVGSKELARKTNAEIWHADSNLDYKYGHSVKENQEFKFGRLKIKALNTPGHTLNSFSYLLFDFSKEPYMIFTGDLLFAEDTGRVDLLGEDMMDELAEKMYDSIFNKVLPLGDGVIICPAHGAGSVCGDSIADRNLTTIGLEKKVNADLQYEKKEEFIEYKKEVLERPPYFRKMEKMNLIENTCLAELKEPKALKPKELNNLIENDDLIILDTRNELSFGAAHIPGSFSIWKDGLASFAGWFLPYDKDIIIITPDLYPEDEIKILHRLGFDKIIGYLSGGMLKWHMAGIKSSSIGMIKVQKVCNIFDSSNDYWILDIRSKDELKNAGEITDAHHIHLTQLPKNIEKIPQNSPIYIFCGSGLRSTVAASILKKEGFDNINVILGGLEGWSSTSCPIVQ
ncbi:MAG: MBL fold metallo-hydrolase [Halanaerobiales bacterium]|nr:MBL fold metallo-hydrolase [Halanaerobiales bacterium]